MPTYEFRCPNGHTFDQFHKISDAPSTAVCPICGEPAERAISGGAGLVFKGSGFYLTDYGKNAHRGGAPAKADGGDAGGKGASGSKESSAKDSGPKESSAKDSGAKESGGASKSGESSSSSSGGGASGGGSSGGSSGSSSGGSSGGSGAAS